MMRSYFFSDPRCTRLVPCCWKGGVGIVKRVPFSLAYRNSTKVQQKRLLILGIGLSLALCRDSTGNNKEGVTSFKVVKNWLFICFFFPRSHPVFEKSNG